MPKCETCGKEFNTEDGLNSHQADKHGMSSHEKKEVKKQQGEQKKEEVHGKAKRKKIRPGSNRDHCRGYWRIFFARVNFQ